MPKPINIIIYRLGSLGDTVIALPCFHLVRRTYPEAKILILTNQPVMGKAAPAMAILENSGLCDEAIAYPVGTRDAQELGKIRQTIRQIQPELFIHLAAGRGLLKSLRDYMFFKTCGVKKIFGTPFHGRDLQARQIGPGEYEPESERLLRRIASLGTVDPGDRPSWDLGLKPDERNAAAAFVPSNGKKYLAVSLGTKVPVKDWGEDNWEKLLELLSAELAGVTLVLLGAADEGERSEKLGRAWAGGCINLCGKTSPRVSAAVLERCRLFIGHDSGPMHLAAVTGVPTIGLFSWFNPPGQWFPGHQSWKFIRVHYPPLPAGGWNTGLQMKRSAQEGILLLRPDEIFTSGMELWGSSPNLISSGSNQSMAAAKAR